MKTIFKVKMLNKIQKISSRRKFLITAISSFAGAIALSTFNPLGILRKNSISKPNSDYGDSIFKPRD